MSGKAGRRFITKGFRDVVDLVLPPRCFISGDIVDSQGMVSPQVWRGLNFITDPFCQVCGYPFSFDVGDQARCTKCLDKPPYFTMARAALRYDDVSREMILKFKHADKTHAVPTFMPWLLRAGAEMITQADMVMPVPLHRLRFIRRRYNQAALIAQALACQCDKAFEPQLLLRNRATPSQGTLGYKARKKNVRGAFAINKQGKNLLKDKNILLVDDVFTTGATADECAKTLKKAGAAKVNVLSLARVVREDSGF